MLQFEFPLRIVAHRLFGLRIQCGFLLLRCYAVWLANVLLRKTGGRFVCGGLSAFDRDGSIRPNSLKNARRQQERTPPGRFGPGLA